MAPKAAPTIAPVLLEPPPLALVELALALALASETVGLMEGRLVEVEVTMVGRNEGAELELETTDEVGRVADVDVADGVVEVVSKVGRRREMTLEKNGWVVVAGSVSRAEV